jgi:hypothetical protein
MLETERLQQTTASSWRLENRHGSNRLKSGRRTTSTPLFLATAMTVLRVPKSQPTTDMVEEDQQATLGDMLLGGGILDGQGSLRR